MSLQRRFALTTIFYNIEHWNWTMRTEVTPNRQQVSDMFMSGTLREQEHVLKIKKHAGGLLEIASLEDTPGGCPEVLHQDTFDRLSWPSAYARECEH